MTKQIVKTNCIQNYSDHKKDFAKKAKLFYFLCAKKSAKKALSTMRNKEHAECP